MNSVIYWTGFLVWVVAVFLTVEILLGQVACAVPDFGPRVFIVACGVEEVGR